MGQAWGRHRADRQTGGVPCTSSKRVVTFSAGFLGLLLPSSDPGEGALRAASQTASSRADPRRADPENKVEPN